MSVSRAERVYRMSSLKMAHNALRNDPQWWGGDYADAVELARFHVDAANSKGVYSGELTRIARTLAEWGELFIAGVEDKVSPSREFKMAMRNLVDRVDAESK